MGTKAERQAARERVYAYHQAQLTKLLATVTAAVDRYQVGDIDAYLMDETIHRYHRAAGELWKFCFSGGGGSHAESISTVKRANPPIWRSFQPSGVADHRTHIRVICTRVPPGQRAEPTFRDAEERAIKAGRGRCCSCCWPKAGYGPVHRPADHP